MAIGGNAIKLINVDYARVVNNEAIEIVEANESGAGKAIFTTNKEALHIKHVRNAPPIKWMKNQKCADGAIVIVDPDVVLHVVELKKTIGNGKWDDIRSQIEGMIFNAIAILAVIGIDRPNEIICHIAYETDRMPAAGSANSISLKFPVGGAKPIGGALDWANSRITLDNFGGITLRKIHRNNASTGVGDLS